MVGIKVGIIQIATKKCAIAHNFRISSDLIKKAVKKGAQIVLTPECMLDGYGFDTPQFQTQPTQFAVSMEDPLILQYSALAKEYSCHLLIGLTIKEPRDAKWIYRNSILSIDAKGNLQGRYNKAHSVFNDNEFKFYTHGEEYPIFNLDMNGTNVPFGVMICYDRQLPEPARILRIKGAKIIFNPLATNNVASSWNTKLLQVRAYENQCYIVCGNHAFPRLCGFSFVVNPMGRVIARLPPWQTIRVISLDLDQVDEQKNMLLTRRPSTYRELLNRFFS